MTATWTITLTALLLCPCGHVDSREHAAQDSDPIAFDWPSDLAAQVQVRVQGQRTLPQVGQVAWNMSATYQFATEARGDDLLVWRRDFEGWENDLPEGVPFLADLIVDRIPTFVVSQEGAFRAIEGVVQARTAILETFEGIPDSQRFVLESATTEAGLTAIAQDFWMTTVGAWLGFDTPAGESLELRNRTAIPQLGGGELDLVVQMRNLGPARCPVKGCEASCIELILRSSPDQDQARELIAGLEGKSGSGFVPVLFELTNEIRLTVEPTTMLPHALAIERESAIDYRDPTGKVWETSESNERSYVFRYR